MELSNFNDGNMHLKVPGTELERRFERLKKELAKNNVDAALIQQRTDLYYFSGTIQQAHLFLPADGQPLLMVNKSTARAMAESTIEHIVHLDRTADIPHLLKDNGYSVPGVLGMELDVLPANLLFACQRLFPGTRIVDISPVLRMIRAVKSPWELALMRRAAELSDRLAGCVPDLMHEGMSELELAGKIEAEARRMGHQGVIRMRLWGSEMFYGHLLSGASGAVPSYLSSPTGGSGASPAVGQGPGFKTIQRHEPVLVDYMFAHNGYLSDHARIFSLGPLAEDLVAAHGAMLEVQQMIKQLARPGVSSGELYARALEKTTDLGYADYFMGVGPERIRFVGHGIGLEVDEFPFLAAGQKLELQVGMTVALEPKLIFPGRGVVGIENTHVVTKSGLEQLSKFPEEIIVV